MKSVSWLPGFIKRANLSELGKLTLRHWKPWWLEKNFYFFGVERPFFFKGEGVNFREGILLKEDVIGHSERMTFSPMLPMSQWLFLFPLNGCRWHIILQLAVYTTYILPSRGLYATYHLLGEPETTIECHTCFFSCSFDKAAQPSEWVEVVFPPPRLFPGCGCTRLTEIPTYRVPGNNSSPGSCRYFCTTYVLLVPWPFGSRGVKERKKNRSILNKNFRNMMGELLY